MILEHQILPLFSVPVCIMKTNLAHSNLVDLVSNLNYVRSDNNDGWISEKNVLNKDEFKHVKDEVSKCFEHYKNNILEAVNNFVLCSSWVTKHDKGDHSPTHMHQNSMFSGVLYIKTDKDSGDLVFHSFNKESVSGVEFSLKYKTQNIYNSKICAIKPNAGDLVFFPSSLHHSVGQSQSTNSRFCLAFNFFVSEFFEDNPTAQIKFKVA